MRANYIYIIEITIYYYILLYITIDYYILLYINNIYYYIYAAIYIVLTRVRLSLPCLISNVMRVLQSYYFVPMYYM